MPKFPFGEWLNNFNLQKDNIADKVGDELVKFFLDEFDEEQWNKSLVGSHETDWQPLAPSTLKAIAAKKNSTRYAPLKMLRDTGDLRAALAASKVSGAKWTLIKFNVDIDYASYHNDGIGQEKRQFIGDSYETNKVIAKTIDTEFKKIFKG